MIKKEFKEVIPEAFVIGAGIAGDAGLPGYR